MCFKLKKMRVKYIDPLAAERETLKGARDNCLCQSITKRYTRYIIFKENRRIIKTNDNKTSCETI